MAKPGKGRTRIGVTVAGAHGAIISARAEPLRMSQAAFVEAIVDQWVAAGCPAVTEADRAMLQMRQLEKALPPKTTKKSA